MMFQVQFLQEGDRVQIEKLLCHKKILNSCVSMQKHNICCRNLMVEINSTNILKPFKNFFQGTKIYFQVENFLISKKKN